MNIYKVKLFWLNKDKKLADSEEKIGAESYDRAVRNAVEQYGEDVQDGLIRIEIEKGEEFFL